MQFLTMRDYKQVFHKTNFWAYTAYLEFALQQLTLCQNNLLSFFEWIKSSRKMWISDDTRVFPVQFQKNDLRHVVVIAKITELITQTRKTTDTSTFARTVFWNSYSVTFTVACVTKTNKIINRHFTINYNLYVPRGKYDIWTCDLNVNF